MTEEFQRLGVFGDWQHPLPDDELPLPGGDRARAGRFVEQRRSSTRARSRSTGASTAGPRSRRPRSSTRTHTSPSIYVEFPLDRVERGRRWRARAPALAGRDVSVLIWTTTPWTIPSNLAIAFHPDFDYGAYELDGRVVHHRRARSPRPSPTAAGRTLARPIARFEGADLEGLRVHASALRARLARRAGRLRHARAGHGRRAHRTRSRRRRLPHRPSSTDSTSTRRSDPTAASPTSRAVCGRAGVRGQPRDRSRR